MTVLFLILLFIVIFFIFTTSRLHHQYNTTVLAYKKIQKEREIVFSFLHGIGTVFTESLTLDTLLHSVLSSIVRILNAKSGCIFLMDDSNKHLYASIIEGTFPPWNQPEASVMEKIMSKKQYLEEYLKTQKISIGTGIIGSTAASGKPCLISDATMDSRVPRFTEEMLTIRTMLMVPLILRDNLLGVLALANKEDFQPFTETDVELLQALGDLSSIAISNARFHQTLLEKQKLDSDLSIARDIQHMLLPRTCPVVQNWDIGVLSKTAMEIGGDYYDFIEIGKDKLGVVIADVSGKSIPGALVMSMTRSILRSKAIGVHSASSVLIAANELICQDIEPNMFISLTYLIIDTKQNTVTYARAGHEPLVVYRAKDSSCELIKPEGMVLGISCDSSFNNCIKEVSFQVHPGDILVLYTDGITESINEKQEEFGLANLVDSVRISNTGSAEDIVNNIRERVNRFTGDVQQKDDLTLVVMKLKK